MRTLLIKGPLTDDELLDIIAVVQRIERDRPEETFAVMVDAPEGQTFEDNLLAQVPLAPGYERITRMVSRTPEDPT